MELMKCPMCERDIPPRLMTDHHLVPQSCGGKNGKNKVEVCTACHSQIHLLFTNKELASKVDTIAKLRKHGAMRPFLKWIAKKPAESIPTRRESVRKKRRK